MASAEMLLASFVAEALCMDDRLVPELDGVREDGWVWVDADSE
jgi:hypothetical protein